MSKADIAEVCPGCGSPVVVVDELCDECCARIAARVRELIRQGQNGAR